jgi:hypothetical protein
VRDIHKVALATACCRVLLTALTSTSSTVC